MPMQTSEARQERVARTPEEIRAWIVQEVAQVLKVEPAQVDADAPLVTLGVASIDTFGLTGALAEWLNRDLPATLASAFVRLCKMLVAASFALPVACTLAPPLTVIDAALSYVVNNTAASTLETVFEKGLAVEEIVTSLVALASILPEAVN